MKMPRKHRTVTLCLLILFCGTLLETFVPTAEARGRGGYRRGRRYPRFQPASLPTVSTSELDSARQELIAARADLRRAQGDFDRLFTGASPALSEPLSTLRAAQLAHEQADAVIAQALETNTDYKAALARKADIERRLAVLRDSGAGNADQIMALATEAMNWGQKATRIQADAESADAKVVETKAALIEASKLANAAVGNTEQALRSDPQWLSAKQRLETAKQRVVAAETRLMAADQSLALSTAAYDRAAVYNRRHGFFNQRVQR